MEKGLHWNRQAMQSLVKKVEVEDYRYYCRRRYLVEVLVDDFAKMPHSWQTVISLNLKEECKRHT
jgi:hypothetical protein